MGGSKDGGVTPQAEPEWGYRVSNFSYLLLLTKCYGFVTFLVYIIDYQIMIVRMLRSTDIKS